MGAVRPVDDDDLIFYPDQDNMGESTLQRLITELLRPLLARFLAERGIKAFVGADQFIYYIKGNPKAVVSPDIYVIPGVNPNIAPRVWKVWETDIWPSFALEVMSEIDDLKDVAHSPQRHAELGTKELVVFDPYVDVVSGRTRFRVYRRDDQGRLVLVLATNQDRIESLQLGCYLRAYGADAELRLRIATGPDGEDLVPTDWEREQRALEQARIDAERARAAAERARAAAESARAAAERVQIAEHAKIEADLEIARLRAEIEALRRK